MRSAISIFLLLIIGLVSKGQTQPPTPDVCAAFPRGKPTITITGSTSFLLDELTDFSTFESSSTININVDNNSTYRVYVAGEIISMVPSATNTTIPINTFTVVATNQLGGPTTPFPLAGIAAYQVLIQNDKTTGSSGRNHQLTITRNALNTFTQQPGTHTLYLHFYLCQLN